MDGLRCQHHVYRALEHASSRRWTRAARSLLFAVSALFVISLAVVARADDEQSPRGDLPLAVVLPDAPDVQLPGGEILALEQGERAPRPGMLIGDEDLVAWRQTIERLSYQLAAERALAGQLLTARLEMERARTRAAEERLTLHETLWRQRAEELSRDLARARADSGPSWYESPILWFAGGVVVTVVAVVAIAVAVK